MIVSGVVVRTVGWDSCRQDDDTCWGVGHMTDCPDYLHLDGGASSRYFITKSMGWGTWYS